MINSIQEYSNAVDSGKSVMESMVSPFWVSEGDGSGILSSECV
jgi:hypothetical protein